MIGGYSTSASAAPYYSEITNTALPTQPCGSGGNQGCYTSSLVLVDIDGDGAIDILLANGGGYYSPGNAEPSSAYRNNGDGTFSNVTSTWFGDTGRRLRQVAVADVNNDGLLDVFFPSGYGIEDDQIYIQTSVGVFADESSTRLPGGASRAGAAHFGDLDDDGDMDLLITDWGDDPLNSPGDVKLYFNDGTGIFTAAAPGVLPAPLPASEGNTPIDIDVADVDGDFDLDILVNHRNGQSRLWRNLGGGQFEDITSNYPVKNGPYTYNVEACDIDGDGDLDLLLDNAAWYYSNGVAEHSSQILINDGNGLFSDETVDRVASEPQSDDNAVKCVDVDNDGDFDLVVASLSNSSEKLMLNDGQGHFTLVADAFPMVNDPTLGIDAADLDGDGIFDIVTGQGEGNPRLDRVYQGISPSVADSTPPKFRAVQTFENGATAGTPIVAHVAISDGHTSEVGQHVSVEATIVTPDSSTNVVPVFMGGDIYRLDLGSHNAGDTISLTWSATDRASNMISSSTINIVVNEGGQGGSGGVSGSGGSSTGATGGSSVGGSSVGGSGGSTSGAAGQGGSSASGGGGSGGSGAQAGGGPGGASGSGGASGASGAGGGTPGNQSSDCDCSVVGATRTNERESRGISALLSLMLSAVVGRRLRSSKR